jgi:hypothetical protein
MEFKRYDNANYRRARDTSPAGRREPSLDDTMRGILCFLNAAGLADLMLASGSIKAAAGTIGPTRTGSPV